MNFREIEYKGFTLKLVDLPPAKGESGYTLHLRRWKVRRGGCTVTTALTLDSARAKVRDRVARAKAAQGWAAREAILSEVVQ